MKIELKIVFWVASCVVSSGWIWTRESQREIEKVKSQYDKDVSVIKNEMELRYRDTLTERCRAAAMLELELENERQRVKGYKQALVSQSQQLMEERKQLQKVNSVFVPYLNISVRVQASLVTCSLSFITQSSIFFLIRSARVWRKRSKGRSNPGLQGLCCIKLWRERMTGSREPPPLWRSSRVSLWNARMPTVPSSDLEITGWRWRRTCCLRSSKNPSGKNWI